MISQSGGGKALRNRFYVIAAVAWIAAAVGMGWLMQAYMPGAGPLHLWADLNVLVKMLSIVSIGALVAAIAGGLMGRRDMVRLAAWIGVGTGLLGALYNEFTIQQGVQAVGGGVSFAATAPGHAESLLVLLIGLTAPVAGLGLLRLRGKG